MKLLTELGALFGVSETALRKAESGDVLSHTEKAFPVARLPNDAELLRVANEVRPKYGNSLTFRLLRGDLPELDIADADLKKQLEDLRTSGQPSFKLDLRLDKKQLATHWNLAGVRLFLFDDALARELAAPLEKLDDDAPLVVFFIPDSAIDLRGRHLAILGGAAFLTWTNPKDGPDERAAMVERARKTDKLKWVGFDLQKLTPLQLDAQWPKDKPPAANDPVAGTLYAQLLACSLVYLAGRSQSNGTDAHDAWSMTFAAGKSVATIELGEPATTRAAMESGSPAPWVAARTLAERAKWVYEEERRVSDRLTIVQHAFAGALEEKPALGELLSKAEDIDKRIQGEWDSFLHGKLDKYLDQVKELENTVDATTKSYSEQVQTLTKSLTDSVVAAVAVVVGSFIAAMFKSPFDPYVFRFGTGVYALYLFVFPMCIGLFVAGQRFRDSRKTFEQRKASYGQRLTERWVGELVGPEVERRECWFRVWLGLTALLYGAVIALLLYGFCAVPEHMLRWNDRFTITRAESGAPKSGTIPMAIYGTNFDEKKEIVITIGRATFTNLDGGVTVKGSNTLRLAPPEGVVKGNRALTIRQGAAPPQTVWLR